MPVKSPFWSDKTVVRQTRVTMYGRPRKLITVILFIVTMLLRFYDNSHKLKVDSIHPYHDSLWYLLNLNILSDH